MKQFLRVGEGYALSKRKPKYIKLRYISLLAVLTSMCLYAVKQVSAQQAEPAATAVADIIGPDAESQYGMLGVHEVGGKIYLEIPDSLLGRDILAVKRLAKGWSGEHPYVFWRGGPVGYAGDHIDEIVFRIQNCASGKNICFVMPDFTERISGEYANIMAKIFNSSAAYPVLASLDIVSRNAQETATIVDISSMVESDHELFGFSKTAKTEFGLGSFNAGMSGRVTVSATSNGLQVTATKAYPTQNPGYPVPIELVANWLVLPKVPLSERLSDDRIGYYTMEYRDFGANIVQATNRKIITRWRMEPKPTDMEKYLRGEMVEPKRPIVFYIDPAVPNHWIPYMIEGINDWQAAFEQAGFKNAIQGKIAPCKDNASTTLYGMGHGYISYKPNPIPSAVTITNIDPRSGEIVGASISWWHGMVRQLITWYKYQAGTSDREAWTGQLNQEVLGKLIRYIVSHEVGHALGLKHNFGAASATPVEKLRDRGWLEKHSFSPSVMDYARTNHIAQPEDSVGLEGIVPRIGMYDKWAIEWAYRYRPPTKEYEMDSSALAEWVESKQQDPSLWYGDEGHQNSDPRCLPEDIGDDPIMSAHYGIHNLKHLLDSLPVWIGNREMTKSTCKDLIRQYQTHISNVVAIIGGRHHRQRGPKVTAEEHASIMDTNQSTALDFLYQNFIKPPLWLLQNRLLADRQEEALTMITDYQETTIRRLLTKLTDGVEPRHLIALQQYVFGVPADEGGKTGEYIRTLQRFYVNELIELARPDVLVPNEQGQLARAITEKLEVRINQILPQITDVRTSTHLRTLRHAIRTYMKS